MSASPAPEAQSQWKEYKNKEGRIYWSHAVTKQSVWEKPDELKTPFERAMIKTSWKQYTSQGKPYYVNSVTKETVWKLPPDLVELQKKVEQEEARRQERERRKALGQASPTPPPKSRSATPDSDSDDETGMALTRYRSPTSATPAPVVETMTIPPGGFTTVEKAEEAFFFLLKRESIDETWTWDQAMRKIVLDPLYKALDTQAQKRAAFEKFQRKIVDEKKAAREARIAELRPHLTRLFKNSGVIKSYSTMKTADKAFASDKYWRRAKADERRHILEEYTTELRNREAAERRDTKAANISSLTSLVKKLDITVTTRWRSARDIILRSEAFRDDPKLAKMDTLDMLNVYDEYTRELEREFEEESHRLRKEHKRRARKARDGFKDLLRELRERGDLTRTSKWKETLPKIRSDERYTALLGLPGSSPLDLWMDTVDDLQVEAEEVAARIEARLPPVQLEDKFESFDAACAATMPEVPAASRKEAFDVIHSRLARAKADEERRAERRRRHQIEDLRDALRHVRALDAETTYDTALPLIKDLPEFKPLTDEDRHAAFEKFTHRLRERAREAESSDAGRRRERDRGDRDRHSERDKDRDRERRRDRGDRMDVDDDRERRRDLWDRDRGDRERDRDRDRDRDRGYGRYSRDRDRDRDRDRYRSDRDRTDRDRERRRDYDRDDRDRDRSDRDRDRDREPRDKDRERDRSDRDRDRGDRERPSASAEPERQDKRRGEHDDREAKRRRVSPAPAAPAPAGGKNDEREEGEI